MNTPARQTCSTATISLVFGILSWFALPFIGAVVCGYMARGEIKRSNGALDGDSMATAGLVLGWIHLALAALIVIAVVVFLVFFGGLAAFSAAV